MRFGSFEVDEKAFQLREHGQPVRLERIPMELMILLVRNRSRLVARDEILAQIWGINHYLESESAVNTAIRKLRRALRDDAAHPRMIETVPGKGYRFIAPAQHESAGVKPPVPDPEAVRCFLRGRHAWNKKTADAYENALVHFQQAIDHDAAYAPSLVGVALCYVMMGIHGLKPATDVYPLARAAAHSALEINADSAEAITALGDVAKGYDRDWKQAEHYFRRAIELNPEYAVAHQWYANLLSIVGRHEEAVTESEKARRLDPLSVGPSGFVGFTLYRARQYDDALRECEKTAELHEQAPISLAIHHYHEQVNVAQNSAISGSARTASKKGIGSSVTRITRSAIAFLIRPIAASCSPAALTPDRKFLNLSVVNATGSERTFDLNVAGAKLDGTPELWQITGRDLQAEDRVGQPPQVTIQKVAAGISPSHLSVAAYSIDVFRIPVAAE